MSTTAGTAADAPGSGPAAKNIDYSVYLVTSRDLLPPQTDFTAHLKLALSNGDVTVVQLREKSIDTGEFLHLARDVLAVCDAAPHGPVPLIINDNLAVALALPKRVGLHLGQTDMSPAAARQVLGPDRVLGISTNTPEQARAARDAGADYIGIGPVYGTQSKAGISAEQILGPRGARAVQRGAGGLASVLIGGINETTALRALVGATDRYSRPEGIAVISAIVARPDADVAAAELATAVRKYKKSASYRSKGGAARAPAHQTDGAAIANETGEFTELNAFNVLPAFLAEGTEFNHEDSSSRVALLEAVKKRSADILTNHRDHPSGPPLVHTITSHVSSTYSANTLLSFSASPIMTHQPEETAAIMTVGEALVLNIGTVGAEAREGMRLAGETSNLLGKPVVLDPVGVGASAFRKAAVNGILNHTQVTLIKANAAELASMLGLSSVQTRGVDAGAGSLANPAAHARELAQRESCLVLLTGKTDYLTDGEVCVSCANGHELLGRVTGTGCALGTLVAAGMAAGARLSRETEQKQQQQGASGQEDLAKGGIGRLMVDAKASDLFAGALTGLLTMTIASELAAARPEVRGPGTFLPALLDEISLMTAEVLLERAKVDVVAPDAASA
ncbi:thiamine biosynthetic bifunctional enzyme [Tilletia horrida]|uniref:Thiamine biosynthetic bifunctional enzyme n=1 Tax=Tilletia horrida TaxID=155126 RepID=A0AAN6G4I7_9BASI|nr:thiamine biosynthetic bifunctional enzyme [Tilletia horrida]